MDHQSNGAAEVIVHMLKLRASLLVQQIKNKIAGGNLVFGMQRTATYYHRKNTVVLKHLAGYRTSHEDICISLKWKGRAVGLFHSYNLEPGEVAIEVFTDAD